MDRMTKLIVSGVVAPAVLAVLAAGCQNDQSASGGSSGGRVVSQTERRDVTPGGTEVNTRTQVRETPSGQRVRETQMRTREDVTPQQNP